MTQKSPNLFIPLKTEYYNQFKEGSKTVEYRVYGPRWNHQTCYIGRPVVLSRGYGKKDRLYGFVDAFFIEENPSKIPGWKECYGDRKDAAACIHIVLHDCHYAR